MSLKVGHDMLTWCRVNWVDCPQGIYDLTYQTWFDWEAWLGARSDKYDVIGVGIYQFCFIWVDPRDRFNRRGDFLVRRVDGSDVRLHPRTMKRDLGDWINSEDRPLYGRWARGVRVESREARRVEFHRGSDDVVTLSQSSFTRIAMRVTRLSMQAQIYQRAKLIEWINKKPPSKELLIDINDVTFNWPLYLHSRPWYGEYFSDTHMSVDRISLAWVRGEGGGPVFLLRRSDGQEMMLDVAATTIS